MPSDNGLACKHKQRRLLDSRWKGCVGWSQQALTTSLHAIRNRPKLGAFSRNISTSSDHRMALARTQVLDMRPALVNSQKKIFLDPHLPSSSHCPRHLTLLQPSISQWPHVLVLEGSNLTIHPTSPNLAPKTVSAFRAIRYLPLAASTLLYTRLIRF